MTFHSVTRLYHLAGAGPGLPGKEGSATWSVLVLVCLGKRALPLGPCWSWSGLCLFGLCKLLFHPPPVFRAVSLTNPKEAPLSCCSNLGWFSGALGKRCCRLPLGLCWSTSYVTTVIHATFIVIEADSIDSVSGATEKEKGTHDCRTEGRRQEQEH